MFLSFLKAAESESSAENISEKLEEIKAAESVEDLIEEMPGTKQDHDTNISKQKELDLQNQEISLLQVCVFSYLSFPSFLQTLIRTSYRHFSSKNVY